MNKWTPIGLVVSGILMGLFWEHTRGSAGSSSVEYAWSVARECVSYLVAYLALSRCRATARLIFVTLLGTFISSLLLRAEYFVRFHEIYVSDRIILGWVIFVPVFGAVVWVLTSLVQAAIGFVHQHFQRA